MDAPTRRLRGPGAPGASWENRRRCTKAQIRRRKRVVGFPPRKGRRSGWWSSRHLESRVCSGSTAVYRGATALSQVANGHEGLELRTRSQTRHVRHRGAAGVKEYRLRRRDRAAWRDIGEGRQKTRDIGRLARAALEREKEVKAYRAEGSDQGWFTGRPGRDACVASQARVWRQRFSGEPGWFAREPGATLWRIGAVLERITAYDEVPYIFVLSGVFRVTLCVAFCVAVIHSGYSRLTMRLQQPGLGMVRGRSRRRSERKAFGVIWPPGIMETRGLAAAAGARAASPASSLPTVPQLKPESLVLLPPARNTTTRQLDRLRAELERRVPRALAGTLPGPSCGFVAGVKEAGKNKAMPAGATPAATLTRPLLPAVLQMCWTFQKSPVNRMVRPCRDSMPGTPLSESRRTMSLRATRALPKRRDAVDAELIDLTDRKGT